MGLTAYVNNRGDRPVEALIVWKLLGQPEQQFEVRYEFPPNQTRQVPIRVPIPEQWKDQSHAEIEVTIFGIVDGREVMLDVEGVPLRDTIRLPISRDPVVAYSSIPTYPQPHPWWYWPARSPNYNYEIIISGKVHSGSSRATIGQTDRPHPFAMSDWQSIDVCIVCDQATLKNANTLDSLRRFIHSGGTAWVLLDEIPLELIRPLLAPGQSCELVDRVELAKFVVDAPDGSLRTLSPVDRTVDSAEPVSFCRVVAAGAKVTHEIDGWPAALTFPQGDGQLFITALAAPGWVRKRTTLQNDPNTSSSFEPRVWNTVLMRSIFCARSRRIELPQGALDHRSQLGRDFAQTMIGNPVASRSLISLVLIAFVSTLTVATAWFGWFGTWKRLAVLVPGVSMLVALGLVVGSLQMRRDIPETAASLRVARTEVTGNSTIVHEQGLVNLTSSRQMQLECDNEGVASVDPSLATSGLKRFESRGLESWSLKNSDWPPGLWSYQAEFVELHDRSVLTGRLSESGLEVSMPEKLDNLTEAILSYQPGQPILGVQKGDVWLFDGSQLASKNRWTTSSILGDEQVGQQQVLNKLLSPNDKLAGWSNSVLFWTNASSSSKWTSELAQQGSTLHILPICLQSPPIQQSVLIPAGLIGVAFDHRDTSRSSTFSERTGAWLESSTQAAKVSLRFSLPECVLPFHVDSIELRLDINAPQRSVKLSNTISGQPKLLDTLSSPSVPWVKRFNRDDLNIDEQGNFFVVLEVSDRVGLATGEVDDKVINWNVNAFQANCRGSRRSMLEPNQK